MSPLPARVAIVSETYPPKVSGVALTVLSLAQGPLTLGHEVELTRPGRLGESATMGLELGDARAFVAASVGLAMDTARCRRPGTQAREAVAYLRPGSLARQFAQIPQQLAHGKTTDPSLDAPQSSPGESL